MLSARFHMIYSKDLLSFHFESIDFSVVFPLKTNLKMESLLNHILPTQTNAPIQTKIVRDPKNPPDTVPKMIRKLPKDCFDLSLSKSLSALALDFGLMALLSYFILKVDTSLVALPLAFLLGTVMTGLFVLGHDAGHRSFSYSETINDVVGHITLAPLLWPFHVWRLSHDVHHRWTHHLEKEIAWRPLTIEQFQAMAPWMQKIYGWSRGGLFFWASILFQQSFVIDGIKGRFFESKDLKKVRLSLIVTLFVGMAYIGGAYALGGGYGVFWLFLVPQLTFHFWLSTFTLFHHTNLKNQLLNQENWTPERAQLANTVHVAFPRIIEFLTHDISWHVPHHICVGIPFHKLRKAHQTLKELYPEWVVERSFGPELIREVISSCHLIEGKNPGEQNWITVKQLALRKPSPSVQTVNT